MLSYVGPLTSLAILWVLFLVIYLVVPNRRMRMRHVWPGALVAALLFGLLQLLFPLYFKVFLAGNTKYGAAGAAVLVVIIWLWLFALILVIGAQVIALSMGLKPIPHDLARTVEDVYDHLAGASLRPASAVGGTGSAIAAHDQWREQETRRAVRDTPAVPARSRGWAVDSVDSTVRPLSRTLEAQGGEEAMMPDAPQGARTETETEGSAQRLLATLERLLAIQATDLTDALTQASQVLVAALRADKVDVFLHDPTTAELVALGVSDTPMGRHEEDIGLDRLPLAQGGRTVAVFQSGTPYLTGHADADPQIDAGFRRDLGIRSMLVVPLEIGGVRRGVVAVDAARPDAFSAADRRFFQAVAHWVGVLAHRSELHERVTREAAAQARRVAAEALINVLAHDLRAPLTPLRGHLNLLRRQARQEGRTEELRHVAEAEACVLRLNAMISDLLDVGRLDQGLFAVAPQSINLAALARETAGALRGPEAQIEVRAADDLVVQADPQRVRQALENLLTNALRHTPPGVPVLLEVARETRDGGVWAVLTVRDAGSGIPPDVLPTIFERFATGPGSTGLGLGLYLARGIAQAHGGTLTVESQPGQGTTCRFSLPVSVVEGAAGGLPSP